MALGSHPQRAFAKVERTAAGLSFDGELLPWSRIARVGIAIDFGYVGTDDTDWLVVEDDAGLCAWIEVTFRNDWGLGLLREGLPDVTIRDATLHSSGPARMNRNTVIWPPSQAGSAMFREETFGIWPFRRVRLLTLPASPG